MGNKSAKPPKHASDKGGTTKHGASKHGAAAAGDNNKVKMRDKKKHPRERPMSAPPASEGRPEIDFTQFVMQRPGDKPIAGKGITVSIYIYTSYR